MVICEVCFFSCKAAVGRPGHFHKRVDVNRDDSTGNEVMCGAIYHPFALWKIPSLALSVIAAPIPAKTV